MDKDVGSGIRLLHLNPDSANQEQRDKGKIIEPIEALVSWLQ